MRFAKEYIKKKSKNGNSNTDIKTYNNAMII